MNGLYQIGAAAPFTRLIRVTPQQDSIKITNRLLSGQMHTQIIGSPVRILNIDVQVDNAGRLILEDLDRTGGTLTVKDDPDTYTGRIMDLGQFSKPIRGYFRTTMTVAVI